MRWDELFADLESQFVLQLQAEHLDLAVEEGRLQHGRLSLSERLEGLSSGGIESRVLLADGRGIDLRVDATGADWVAGELRLGERARGVVVPVAAIAAILPSTTQLDGGSGRRAPEGMAELSRRMGLAFVLRDLSRRRVVVDLHARSGRSRGRIIRVAADHLDLAEHDPAELHAPTSRIRLVPFSDLVMLQT